MARKLSEIIGFNNNPNLKPCNYPIEFTEEHVRELARCSVDPIYFIEKYINIVNVDLGTIPFILHDYQKDYINLIQNNLRVISCMSRQCGKTITTAAYLVWYVHFHEDKTVAILCNKESIAKKTLRDIRLMVEKIPRWLSQGIKSWAKTEIELENGSQIITSSSSASSIRGKTCAILYVDEAAYLAKNVEDEFFTSVFPTVSSAKTSRIILNSTPNGLNRFHKMFVEAERGESEYKLQVVKWDSVPGRDSAWRKRMIDDIGEEAFQQECELEFFGTSKRSLVSKSVLKSFNHVKPIYSTEDGLDVYEYPVADHQYILAVDTAEGLDQDSSAFIVVDISQEPYKVVAKFKSASIAPSVYPAVIADIGRKYNEAFIICELNGPGGQISDSLRMEFNYLNMFSTQKDKKSDTDKLSLDSSKKSRFGLKLTKSSRNIGCTNLRSLLESKQLDIPDYDIIQELSTFIFKNGKYQADAGYHDDTVSCLILFGFLVSQRFFKYLTDTNIADRMDQKYLSGLETIEKPIAYINYDPKAEQAELAFKELSHWEFANPFINFRGAKESIDWFYPDAAQKRSELKEYQALSTVLTKHKV